jgi:hypothetical protein
LQLTKLPLELTTLGARSFSGTGSGVYITELPVGVVTIPTQCFSGSGVAITHFGGENSALQSIGYAAFAFNTDPLVTEIYIDKNVKLL